MDMDPESSSITIQPIANRPGLVALWGEDKVSKFESLLLQSKIERGGNQVRKYYTPPKPKPTRVFKEGEDPFSIDSDDDESDDECLACLDFNGVDVEEINKWDREDYSLVVSRPLSRPDLNPFTGGMTQRYTCVWSGGVHSITEAFIGFMWVAVHGMNSICVATRFHDLNDECGRRMLMSGDHPILSSLLFQKGLIGKVEGFVDRHSRHFHQIMKKPFGVVSLISSTTDAYQETDDDAIEASGAVEYLKEKLKSGSDLDPDESETIQTAISALQHQCNQEFTAADDIWVCVLREGDVMCLPRREIEEHLAEINNPTTKPFEDR